MIAYLDFIVTWHFHPYKILRVSSGIDPTLRGGGIAVVGTIGISCTARFIHQWCL